MLNLPSSRQAASLNPSPNALLNAIKNYGQQNTPIYPLVTFRIVFGAIMFISIFRFWYKGWIAELYIQPNYFFTFYGFDWVQPLSGNGMYWLFGLLALSSVLIMLGGFYRISTLLFFLIFTYVELIDKTNYLNHYYFVSLVSFLLIWVPANRYFSLDVLFNWVKENTYVPRWSVDIFKLQLSIVYFYAGLAKINADWLFRALPMAIWLPSKAHLPIIGQLFDYKWVAFLFSWVGMFYDLSIAFFLWANRTRVWAYVAVVIFHAMTAYLFPIGMFPWIMILSTLIFFSADFHKRLLFLLKGKRSWTEYPPLSVQKNFNPLVEKALLGFLTVFFIFQVLLPFRYTLYPNDLFWTEQGYRFSWRVMLMEKGGSTTFYIKDSETGRQSIVDSNEYLTPQQEKMMSTQADMILEFAHFLDREYQKKGITDPIVTAHSFVNLNGQGSRLFIDKSIDLSQEKRGWHHKKWILPYKPENADD